MTLKALMLTAVIMAWAGTTEASTITIMLGDDDCFGFSSIGACPDNSEIPATNVDNSTPSDPSGTDNVGNLGTLDFGFSFSAGSEVVTSATISLRTAGINLNGGVFDVDGLDGAAFFLNGTLLGTYYLSGADAFSLGIDSELAVKTLSFSVTPGSVIEGINTLRILPEQDLLGYGVSEAYGVDFVRFTAQTAPPGPIQPGTVPLPAGGILLLSALGGLGFAARRRRAA